MERLLKPAEVAEILGVSRDTARAKMSSMPGVVDIGNEYCRELRISESALEAYIANQTVIPLTTNRIERRNRK